MRSFHRNKCFGQTSSGDLEITWTDLADLRLPAPTCAYLQLIAGVRPPAPAGTRPGARRKGKTPSESHETSWRRFGALSLVQLTHETDHRHYLSNFLWKRPTWFVRWSKHVAWLAAMGVAHQLRVTTQWAAHLSVFFSATL